MLRFRYARSFSTSRSSRSSSTTIILLSTTSLVGAYASATYIASVNPEFNEIFSKTPGSKQALDLLSKLQQGNIQKLAHESVLTIGKATHDASREVEKVLATATEYGKEASKVVEGGVESVVGAYKNVAGGLDQAKDTVVATVETLFGDGKKVDAVNKVVDEKKPEAVKLDIKSSKPEGAVVAKKSEVKVDEKMPEEKSVEKMPEEKVVEKPRKPEVKAVEKKPQVVTVDRKPEEVVIVEKEEAKKEDVEESDQRNFLIKSIKNLSELLVELESSQLDAATRATVVETKKAVESATQNLHSVVHESASDLLTHQNSLFEEFLQVLVAEHQQQLQTLSESHQLKTKELVAQATDELVQQHNAKLALALSQQAEILTQTHEKDLVEKISTVTEHWKQQVKKRVDAERDGRLARLDLLQLRLVQLEKLLLTTAESTARAAQIREMWVLVRSISSTLSSPFTTSVKDKAEALLSLAQSHELIKTVTPYLTPLIPSLSDLKSKWNRVESVLISTQFLSKPVTPVTYTLSHLFSKLMLSKSGLVPGDDVMSVIARTRYFLDAGDVESAAREVNSLDGVQGNVVEDWLRDARVWCEAQTAVGVIACHLEFCDLGLL